MDALMPGDWYSSLAKPEWTPPPWVFGPAWTILYAMMAGAAWRLWRRLGARPLEARRALVLFTVQLALNLAWTPVFFGMQRPDLALVVIIALWVAIVATIMAAWKACKTAAALLMPYLAWVTFATALNMAIWRLN
jgi:tryptophan-rich sensory protein